MCSILGASSPNPIDFNDIKLLYMMAEERGGHACGFTNKRSVIKDAVTAPEFIERFMVSGAGMEGGIPEKFPRINREFIGHTRYATVGDKGDAKNAHPFKAGHLVGVHNGSINNHDDLQTLQDTDFDVDSRVLYDYIEKYGLKRTLPLLQGQLGLAYWDLRENNHQIHLYRFDKPLAIGYKEEALFFASLPEHLWALDCTKVEMIQKHTLYKIKKGKIIEAKNLKNELLPTPKLSKTQDAVHIFDDKRQHVRALKDKHINDVLDAIEKEEEKQRDNKIIGFVPDKKAVTEGDQEVVVDGDFDADHIPFKYKAPNNALSTLTTEDELVLYWFDDEDANKVYLELEHRNAIDVCQLNLKEDVQILKDIIPVAFDDINRDYQRILKTNRLRNDKEKSNA